MRFAQLSLGRDDRCLVLPRGDRFLLAVADGAGGSGRGAQAAETVMRYLEQTTDPFDAAELLRRCDQALAGSGGETTAVIAVVDPHGISGASVGDSEAWLVEAAIGEPS